MKDAPITFRSVVLCADDYGMDPAIDAGIRHLLKSGRLSATACMSLAPGWPDAARALSPLRGRVGVGLHFSLTEPFPGRPAQTLGRVIRDAYLRPGQGKALRRAWAEQLDAFERHWGAPPDFIDGHQHVHQLPQVRQAMLAELAERYPRRRPWIRVTVPKSWRGLKAMVIALLGGHALRRELRRLGWPRNGDFLGVYDFRPARFAAAMTRWLGQAGAGAVIMCHPGEAGDYPLAESRPVELAWLASPAAGEVLREQGVRLTTSPVARS